MNQYYHVGLYSTTLYGTLDVIHGFDGLDDVDNDSWWGHTNKDDLASPDQIAERIKKKIANNPVIVTTIQTMTNTERALKKCGFKLILSFCNDNTDNRIKVWFYNNKREHRFCKDVVAKKEVTKIRKLREIYGFPGCCGIDTLKDLVQLESIESKNFTVTEAKDYLRDSPGVVLTAKLASQKNHIRILKNQLKFKPLISFKSVNRWINVYYKPKRGARCPFASKAKAFR